MVGFPFRNMKGYRFLAVIAEVMTVAQDGDRVHVAPTAVIQYEVLR